MKHAWQNWTSVIAERLSDQLDVKVEAEEIVIPPDAKLGDLAFGCFRLAKARKQSPNEVAREIAGAFDIANSDIASVSAAGPYVNFTLSVGHVVHRVVRDVEVTGEGYGSSTIGAKEGQWLVEYANPNTHKELHVGHLRNIILGVSLSRLLQATGYPIVPISYINDVGSNVGKCLWRLVSSQGFDVKAFGSKELEALLKAIPKEKRNGNYLGLIYTEASREVEEDEDRKEIVSFVQQKLEEHDPVWEELWRETRRWCLDEMSEIFHDLGVRIEKQYYESDLLDRSHEVVKELLKSGVAKESEGAIIVDMEEEKLGVALLRKTDGTLLYAAKDLALVETKLKDFPEMRKSYVLVDHRQSLYFRQLATIVKRMGVAVPFDFIGYELVTLKEGAMSSRKGNIITFQALRDATVDYARSEILKRHDDWSEGKVTHVAWAIAMAGMKFGMLKQDNDKIYVFDMEQALSFDGSTGPYCQYAATRLASIIRKSGKSFDGEAPLSRAFDHDTEKALAMTLAQFPAKVELAARELRPSIVAQWCVDVAQRINDFYRDVPVLESTGDLLEGRLRFASAARQVLAKGLDLLGIPLPEEM